MEITEEEAQSWRIDEVVAVLRCLNCGGVTPFAGGAKGTCYLGCRPQGMPFRGSGDPTGWFVAGIDLSAVQRCKYKISPIANGRVCYCGKWSFSRNES